MNSERFNDVRGHKDKILGPDPKKRKLDSQVPYDWTPMLNEADCVAADVSWFKHVPVAKIWTQIKVGLKVEVENPDKSCWEARIIQLKGYKALLRYEGLEDDPSNDFWVHVCTEDVHHLGWCESTGKTLTPPSFIEGKLIGYRKSKFANTESLPSNFQEQIIEDLNPKYLHGSQVEAVDMNNMSQVRLAIVKTHLEGQRMYLEYLNVKDSERDETFISGFWCHQDSPLIHPEGWALIVGHQIVASKSYRPRPVSQGPSNIGRSTQSLTEGMKLETIDPGNFLDFRCATVKKVLGLEYIMIQVDCDEGEAKESDWFCVSGKSPYIFPCGFSAKHGLPLAPPLPYKADGSFQWKTYLQNTRSRVAVLPKWTANTKVEHEFQEGMKIEAADLKNPQIICVATVTKVVGRLLKIHFDGWEDEYDQWVDATSPDIYPVGWSELVSFPLEGPRSSLPNHNDSSMPVPEKINKQALQPALISNVQDVTTTVISEDVKKASIVNVAPNKSGQNISKLVASVPSKESLKKKEISHQLMVRISPPHRVGHKVNQQTDAKKTDVGAQRVTIAKQAEMSPLPGSFDNPRKWRVPEVQQFLKDKDCTEFCNSFAEKNVTGSKLLSLNRLKIMDLCREALPKSIFKLLSSIKELQNVPAAAAPALTKRTRSSGSPIVGTIHTIGLK